MPSILKKDREKLFPEIKDFTKPFNKYKNKNPLKITYNQWFWFHPSAFQLLYPGIFICGAINFTLATLYLLIKELNILAIFSTLFALLFTYQAINKIKDLKTLKNITFYDYFIRD